MSELDSLYNLLLTALALFFHALRFTKFNLLSRSALASENPFLCKQLALHLEIKAKPRRATMLLGIIGADLQQGAIIQCAEISMEFGILVFRSNGRMLNPDRYLNGA